MTTGARVSGWSLLMVVACGVAACESGKREDVAHKARAVTTGLQPGDVAITCVNSQNIGGLDFFEITPLVPIDNNSDIRYTDREATAAGQFNTGEAVNVPVQLNPTDGGIASIPAGRPIHFESGGISSVADQIFLYQGSIGELDADAGALSGGQFLWGFQLSPPGGWATTRDDLNSISERLTALLGNDTAVSTASGNVMFFYSGPPVGTKAQLQAAIANPANWTGASPAFPALCPGPLTVLADTGAGGGTGAGGDTAAGGDTGAGGVTGAGGATAPPGTTGLQPGDVAITCVNGLNAVPDFFEITPLVPIDNDSVIRYTDREATAAGQFNTSEVANVPISLNPTDAGLTTVAAGTVIHFDTSGISSTTDQIFLYQGSIGEPDADAGVLTGGSFLWGFQLSPMGGWAATRDDLNSLSERLIALDGRDTAVSSAGGDGGTRGMFFYSGPTVGTKAQLEAAIADPSNWTGTSVPDAGLCPHAFIVIPETGAGGDTGTGGDTGMGGDTGAGGVTGTGGATGVGGCGAGGSRSNDDNHEHRRRQRDDSRRY